MAVFDKTESLVTMPLCSAFTAADNTDALAAGSIAEMSVQRVGTNVALCCCRMNMPSAGRAKLADCNVHEDNKVIGKQLSKLCVPKLRRAAQETVNCSRMTTTRSFSNEYSCSAQRERTARHAGVAARRSCVAISLHNQFWRSVTFRAI